MPDDNVQRATRVALERALLANQTDAAELLLTELVRGDPTNPRWPHKRGDLHRKLGRTADAVVSYAQAVDAYAERGFLARAIAMAKTVLSLDPRRLDILERVDPDAAQRLRSRERRTRALQPALANGGADVETPPLASPAVPVNTPRPAVAAAGAGRTVSDLKLADLYAMEIEGVQELRADPTSPANETRFPNASIAPGHELMISDAEVQPRERKSEFEELYEEAPSASVRCVAAAPAVRWSAQKRARGRDLRLRAD